MVANEADLDRELAAAQAAGKPVMLDFYADWCVSCKEMEKYTFTDAQVQQALAGFVLLKADVTANGPADQALLQRFGIFGPPTTAFFGGHGRECRNFRLVGFVVCRRLPAAPGALRPGVLSLKPKVIAGLLALATLAGVAGYYLSQTLRPAPVLVPAATPIVVPERRPDFELMDRHGIVRAISEWDGRPLVVNFWATWCAPCRREIPMLNTLARDSEPAGWAVIGIAVDFREDVLRYVEATPVDYAVLIGEQEGLDVARGFGVETLGFPFTVFTDKQGRIVTIHVGELHRPQADLIMGQVAAVDRGEQALKAAREAIRQKMPGLKHDRS